MSRRETAGVWVAREDSGEGLAEPDEKKCLPSTWAQTRSVPDIPAPGRMWLFKNSVRLRLISSQLRVYAVLINQYSYSLTPQARRRFEEYQQKHQRDIQNFERLQAQMVNSGAPIEIKKPCRDPLDELQTMLKHYTTMHGCLNQYLGDRLQALQEILREDTDDFLRMSMRCLQKILSQHDTLLSGQDVLIHTQAANEACAALKTETDRHLIALQTIPQRLKQQSVKGFSLNRCKTAGWSEMVRWRQHAIVAIQGRLQNADDLLRDAPLVVKLPSAWLTADGYRDVIFLSTLLKPAALLPALERQQAFWLGLYHDLQQKVTALIKKLGDRECRTAIRWLRIQTLYERWQSYLRQFENQLETVSGNWNRSVKLQRLLTYEKKTFLQQCLTQEPAYKVVVRLSDRVKQHPEMASLIPQLRREKQQLRAAVAAQEARLAAGQNRWQTLMAAAWLSVSQQPDYQLGEQAFLSGIHQVDRLKNVPVFNAPLPEPMKKQWMGYTGFAFFAIGLSVSNYVGYYAHAIGAINRIFSSQINLCFRAGNAGERFFLCDEIQVLENDRRIQWLNGLCINLLLAPAQPWLSTVLGYTLAMASVDAAIYWIDEAARYQNRELEPSHFIKIAAHLAVYAKAYRQGLLWAHQILPPPVPVRMTASEALHHFGFLKPPQTGREVKNRYYELSRRFHPDKCQAQDCTDANTKMAMINEASEVLLQPFRRSAG